jgi:hypothetical protein
MGALLCILAFLLAMIAGRRSLVAGITAVIAVGYAYGILRANFPSSASHFIFDAAVLGLYSAQLSAMLSTQQQRQAKEVTVWVIMLIAWPTLLVFLPMQDRLVQLVGLRGNVFLLPFILLGARLSRNDVGTLAVRLSVLNILAFVVAAVQFQFGLEPFFPRNANTALIYMSADVGSSGQYRIPSMFSSAHAYAGTMVMTIPLILGATVLSPANLHRRVLFVIAMAGTILGVLMAATRMHSVALGVVLLAAAVSRRFPLQAKLMGVLVLAIIGTLTLKEERLQRFTTLDNTTYLSERVAGSVNRGFFDLLVRYPFGNGLGGGGTSLPYFLRDRLQDPVIMENEYARILLEQGCIGLCLWIVFIAWVASRRFSATSQEWGLGESLAWVAGIVYFGTGLIGLGLFTSIPQSCLFMLSLGWVCSRTAYEPRTSFVFEPTAQDVYSV